MSWQLNLCDPNYKTKYLKVFTFKGNLQRCTFESWTGKKVSSSTRRSLCREWSESKGVVFGLVSQQEDNAKDVDEGQKEL